MRVSVNSSRVYANDTVVSVNTSYPYLWFPFIPTAYGTLRNIWISETADSPAWQSGEPTVGRYWQARVTVTSPFVVVDRIEFLPYSDRLSQHSMSVSF